MKKCNAALIGINGFGKVHLKQMLELQESGVLTLIAVSELHIAVEDAEMLRMKGVQCYTDYNEMLASEKQLDLVVICTPIHLHRDMGISVMKAGCHVFLEKPPASMIQDVDKLIEVSLETGKRCAVNFLLASGRAFIELQSMIETGALGHKIKAITGVGQLQRSDEYYKRTFWAGKVKSNENYVLDGAINNPLSHLLNNILILSEACTEGEERGNAPIEVTAELYHANDIEGDDTSCIRVVTSKGVELYFYATLCGEKGMIPYIRVEGTEASATWHYDNTLVLEKAGVSTTYRFGEENYLDNMYRNLIQVINGAEEKLICPIEATRAFMLVSNGAFESSRRIHPIPLTNIHKEVQGSATVNIIEHMSELMKAASEQNRLFSELGTQWAVESRPFQLEGYKQFPVLFVYERL